MRGVSLVELLIGIAIGLLIVAAGLSFLASNLRESGDLLLEGRLVQDLRNAADIVTRDLRRAGYWASAASGIQTAGASAVLPNPYATVTSGPGNVSFQFSRDASENNRVDANEQFGFRLRDGTLEAQLGADNWQALTDSGTLQVTEFSVTPSLQQVSLGDACATACAPTSTTCPPHLDVLSFALRISGRSVADAHITRTMHSNVRLRTDTLVGACAA